MKVRVRRANISVQGQELRLARTGVYLIQVSIAFAVGHSNVRDARWKNYRLEPPATSFAGNCGSFPIFLVRDLDSVRFAAIDFGDVPTKLGFLEYNAMPVAARFCRHDRNSKKANDA